MNPPYELIGRITVWTLVTLVTVTVCVAFLIGFYIGLYRGLGRLRSLLWANANPEEGEPPVYWRWRLSFLLHQLQTLLLFSIPPRWKTYQQKLEETDADF